MNRLVLIGNGFDLAHGLKTSYADFINWYKEYRIKDILNNQHSNIAKDELCTLKLNRQEAWSIHMTNLLHNNIGAEYKDVFDYISKYDGDYEPMLTKFFHSICTSIETKGWVDIENEYYELLKQYAFPSQVSMQSAEPSIRSLNRQLDYFKKMLCQYLQEVVQNEVPKIPSIDEAIYAPIKEEDVAIGSRKCVQEHKEYWERHEERDEELRRIVRKYGLDDIQCLGQAYYWRKDQPNGSTLYPDAFLLPKEIMLLNFNYTNTSSIYRKNHLSFADNHIHGNLDDPKSIIFGYGDELDDKFKELKEHKNNACLSHIKSIRYLEAPNYRNMLSFIESEPFQVIILGHSCGNSDRTLLNTIFEHPNCVSIKPYYYQKNANSDNYTEIVQHISRNFNNMKLMRDRVVNKTQCEPLVHD